MYAVGLPYAVDSQASDGGATRTSRGKPISSPTA